MMLLMHSQPGRPLAFAARAAILAIATAAAGCSTEFSRDFPGFSLTDDRKETTTASLQTPSGSGPRGPSYLGNEGSEGTQRSYNRGYVAPGTYRDSGDNGVRTANLQEASPPPASYPPPQRQPDALPPPRQAAPALRPGESIEVHPGDTLYNLSRHHNVSVAEMMEVNGLSNPTLQPGQRIYLPEGYRAQPRSEPRPEPRPEQRYEPRHEPRVAAAEAPRADPRPSFGNQNPPPAAPTSGFDDTYTVKNGDSIYAIARARGINVAELQQANGITDVRGVRPGTVLKVPARVTDPRATVAEPSQPSPASDEPSTVEPGTPPPQDEAPSTITVAPEAPEVLGSTQQPTVINRTEPQVAMRDDGAPTGTIVPPAATQPKRTTTGSDKLRWPVQGKILAGFGQRNDGTHNDGINLSVPLGTTVHAAEAGTVAYAGSELKGYGNLVLLRHDNGWVTAYAHNEQIVVKRGDKVERGAAIAKAGRSGSVDQPQVHFELRQGSKPVDPVPFLEQL